MLHIFKTLILHCQCLYFIEIIKLSLSARDVIANTTAYVINMAQKPGLQSHVRLSQLPFQQQQNVSPVNTVRVFDLFHIGSDKVPVSFGC